MTEFEQQVADALWHALETSPVPPQATPSYFGAVRALAPRVAAAFLETVDGNDVQAQADFVAALKSVAP